jgi:Competence protein
MRLSPSWTILLILTLLSLYIAVVEQRPPVLRAGLMAAVVVVGGFFYRRLELLNSAALAGILLLTARPLALRDSSFQLSFAAIGWSGTDATFIWPENSPDAMASAARNNDSLVFRLRYGSRTILLPEDAEKDAERIMLAENPDQSCEPTF